MPKNLYRGIYLCLGYPNLEKSLTCLRILNKSKNIDFIELGLPFSDPIADGKVISEAAQIALQEAQKSGLSPQDMLTAATQQQNSQKDIYLMTYANVIYNLDLHNFKQLDGLIIPDLPLKEQGFFAKLEQPIIPFVTPETKDFSLLEQTIKESKNNGKKVKFVYFVAVRGITGAQTDFTDKTLRKQYSAVHVDCPVVVGFGIRSKREVAQVAEFANGYVIGTAAVQLQNDSKAYQAFIESL